MSNGQGYAARHLEHSDYYAEGQRVMGHWQGHGAELLGLSGEVKSEQFEAIREGLDPASGEFLRQRQSADRIVLDGTTQSRGRNLYDFTFSAPKSVSIVAELASDERLVAAHQKAVGEALQELESQAATRVRQKNANENRITGNLVVAVYHHDTSRELDPLLHTHAVAGNLTYDGVEGRWKALQASGIYEKRAYLTGCGRVRPFSHRLTVPKDTPSRRASCSCHRLSSDRNALMPSGAFRSRARTLRQPHTITNRVRIEIDLFGRSRLQRRGLQLCIRALP